MSDEELNQRKREIFEARCRWGASCKEPDAMKGTEYLTRLGDDERQYDCCLGKACKLFGLKAGSGSVRPTVIRYEDMTGDSSKTLLPERACLILNITREGALTKRGIEIAKHHRTMVNVNDERFGCDKTLFRVGSLIEELLVEEYLFGKECFMPPDNGIDL